MADLLLILKHEDTKMQASAADCLGQLVKHGPSFIPETTDIISLPEEMLKSEDIDARISSLHCLLQLADLKKSGVLPPCFSILICKTNRPSLAAYWDPYSEPVHRILLEENGAQVLLEMLNCPDLEIQNRSALCLSRLAGDSKVSNLTHLMGCRHINALADDVRKIILNADALSTIAKMLKILVTLWSGVTSLTYLAEYGPLSCSVILWFQLSQYNLRGCQTCNLSHQYSRRPRKNTC